MTASSDRPAAPARRRFIRIVAAAALSAGAVPARAAPGVHRWRGRALGADAEITLPAHAVGDPDALIARCREEIGRLEAVFSLFLEELELSRLNRDGRLTSPSQDLRAALEASRRVAMATGGAFDPTVQPLWRLYDRHFAADRGRVDGPPPEAIARALDRVGIRRVVVGPDAVEFETQGMAITLNGIAQGYITDSVADLLRARGVGDVLVDLGEYRALGRHPDGRPWRVGIRAPDRLFEIADRVDLADEALATSGGYGYRFDGAGRFTHLIDPRTGRSTPRYRSLSVVARRAVDADALSTAFALMDEGDIRRVAAEFGVRRVIVVDGAGSRALVG